MKWIVTKLNIIVLYSDVDVHHWLKIVSLLFVWRGHYGGHFERKLSSWLIVAKINSACNANVPILHCTILCYSKDNSRIEVLQYCNVCKLRNDVDLSMR